MSWGEQQQPPYDPNQPYGQAQPPYQPYEQPSGQQYPFPTPAAPYPQPDYAQFQPPPKKGNGTLIGIVIGAVVVVGGGITAAVVLTGGHGGNQPSPAALSLPSSVNGLTLLHTAQADSAVNAMKSTFASASEQFPDPVYGAYNDAGGTDVTTILVDQSISKLNSTVQEQLKTSSAGFVVNTIMSDAGVSNAQSESTSAGSGALSCGSKQESDSNGNAVPVTICVWYDGDTYGTLQYIDNTTPGTAAPVADAVRSAAEG